MPAATDRRTPLDEVHDALGATMTNFAGWRMPLRYGSESAEHTAVRERAGLFDLTHMGEVEVTGAEAGRALDHALVGRPSALGIGRARYTMLCEPDGGILDDLIVYRTDDQTYLVVANAANAALVVAELASRAEEFQASVHDRGAEWALLALQGPRAAGLLSTRCTVPLADLRYYASVRAEVAGVPVLLARTGYTGEDGFELFVAPSAAVRLWQALSDAETDDGVRAVPCGLSCRDTLRLEAGMPLYGHELTRRTTPYEAGLGRVVTLDKPEDFVGRAALARRAAEGPQATLVGLVSSGRRVPRAGYPVLTRDGGQIGVVTSGAPSPTLGRPIAMAYLSPGDHTAPGTALAVDVRGRSEPVEVTALPFYRRGHAGTAT